MACDKEPRLQKFRNDGKGEQEAKVREEREAVYAGESLDGGREGLRAIFCRKFCKKGGLVAKDMR